MSAYYHAGSTFVKHHAAVTEAVTAAQAASAGGAAGRVYIESDGEQLCMELSRPVPLPELRRHKRGFMKLTTQHDAAKLQGAAAAKRMFVDYVMEHVI